MDADKVTDAQAVEIMLTLPWQFGDLNEDGEACYSDDEIQTVIGYVRKIAARAEAAEADVYKLGSRLAEWIERAHNAEAEAEVASLREQVAALEAEVERLRRENTGYRVTVGMLRSDVAALQDRIKGTEVENARLSETVNDAMELQKRYYDDNARLREQVAALTAERDDYLDALVRCAEGDWDAEPAWYANEVLLRHEQA